MAGLVGLDKRGRLSNLDLRSLRKDMSEVLKIMKSIDNVHMKWVAPSELLACCRATFEV